MGFDIEDTDISGGGYGNVTSALEIPILDAPGSVGHGGHAHDGYVDLDYLPERTAILTRLSETLKL